MFDVRCNALRLVILLILPILLSACGRPDLDRNGAARLILQHKDITELQEKVLIDTTGLALGGQMEWWKSTPPVRRVSAVPAAINSDVVTPDPQKFDTDFSFLIPKQKIQIEVSVTGIANGPDESSRLVDFSWTYVNLPKHLGWVAISGGSATAKATLYDDGWRIQELTNRKLSNKAYVSGSEKEELEAYVQQLGEKRRAAENAVAESIAKLIQKVKDSRVATRTIKSFRFESTEHPDHYFSLVVTDAGVRITQKNYSGQSGDFEKTFANSRRDIPVATWRYHQSRPRTIELFGIVANIEDNEANALKIEDMFETINSAHDAWRVEFPDVIWACQLIRSMNWGCDDQSHFSWERALPRALETAFFDEA